jgi:hypothetical protein
MWTSLIAYARASPGTLVLPISNSVDGAASDAAIAEAAGCDVLKDMASIVQWVLNNSTQRLVVGTFLYADGALFSRLAAAADVVVTLLCQARPTTALMGLCSPTEVFSVPEAAQAEARSRYYSITVHTPWERAIGVVSRHRYLEQNAAEIAGDHLVQDSQVWSQG